MLKKLRIRFVIVNMAIVTVMLCVIFGMVYHFTQQNLEEQSLTLLRTASVAPLTAPRPGSDNMQVNIPCFSIRQEGETWIAYDNRYYDLSDVQYLQEVALAADSQGEETGILKEYSLRYYQSTTPKGRQIAFVDISVEQQTLKQLVKTCGLIGALSFSIFLGISLCLAKWVTKPVDTAWKQQKQFIADASHELKTPLAVIQTSAELLTQEENLTERKHFTENILEMSQRMRRLIEEMLALAKTDASQTLQKVTSVDFSHVVTETILPFDPIFFEANLTLSTQIKEGILLKGDSAKLRQVVEVLLDNARKYSTPKGKIQLTLQKKDDVAVLCVSNPSEPLTKQQCRDVFKRFYRVDTARTGGESFGLGLSIAESIVHQHGGKIWADCENNIFTVTAEIPC